MYLKKKYFTPSLLIYLILTFLQIILATTFLILVIVKELHGISESQILINVCSSRTNFKLTFFIKNIHMIMFGSSILLLLFSISQKIFICIKYYKLFQQNKQQNNAESKKQSNFEQITENNLIFLFIANSIGTLIAILMFEHSLSFFLQCLQCSILQKNSTNYFIFAIPSFLLFLIQLLILIIIMRLIFRFHQQKQLRQKNNKDFYFSFQNKIMNDIGFEKNNVNKNNLLSPKSKNNQMNNSSYFQPEDTYQSDNYSNRQRDMDTSLLNKSDFRNESNRNEEYKNPSKQMLKQIGRYPYSKQNQNNPYAPNNIIFQQQQISSQNSILKTSRKSLLSNLKIPQERRFNQSQEFKKQQQKISPELRRLLKQKKLKFTSKVLNFNNLDDDFQYDFFTNNNDQDLNFDNGINRKKSTNNRKKSQTSDINSPISPKTPKHKNRDHLLKEKDDRKNLKKPTNQINLQNSRNKSCKIVNQIDQNIQTQHPFLNYLDQDQQHDKRTNQIKEFQKFSNRYRGYYYNPQSLQENQVEEQAKLYLHKNKASNLEGQINEEGKQFNPFNNQESWIQQQITNRQLRQLQRQNIQKFKIMPKSQIKKQLKQSEIMQSSSQKKNNKKDNKKESVLVDFLRSKYVID